MAQLKEIFKLKDRTFSFEVFPAKTPEGDIRLIHEILKEFALLKPDFFSCTYGAGGGNRDKTLAIVEHIQKAYNIPSVAHLTSICHTKQEIANILKKISEKGIKNILAMRGDYPKDNPNPPKDNYKYSSELITYIRNEYKDQFCLGVAGFPEMHPLSPDRQSDIKYLKYKIDCGADFVITQLFFDNRLYFDYVKYVRQAGITTRIIPGILPITSYDGLVKFCESCKASIPQEIHKIFAPIRNNPKKILETGTEYAIEQCKELLNNGAPGIHFYTLNKVEPVKKIISIVR